MFNQGRVSPSGGSLASFSLSCSRKNLAPSGSFYVGLVPLVCVLHPSKAAWLLPPCCNSCCKFLPMLGLGSAGATFREQLPKTSQIFVNSQGFGQFLSVVIPRKTWKKVLAQQHKCDLTWWPHGKITRLERDQWTPRCHWDFSFSFSTCWFDIPVLVALPLNFLRSFSSAISDFSS